MWRRYFKLVKLVPGKVIVQGYGTLDFAGNVPVETCKALFEADFEFLEITEEGKKELYGIKSSVFSVQSLETEPVTGNEESVTANEEPVTSNEEPVTKKRRTRKKKEV